MSEGLKQRISTALLFGAPFLIFLIYNDFSRIILLSGLIIISAVEFLKLNYNEWYKSLLAILSIIISAVIIYLNISSKLPFAWVLYAGLIANLVLIIDLFVSKKSILKSIPWLTGVFYTTIPYSIFIAYSQDHNLKLIFLSTIILIWICDSSAYLVGKSIGKRKLMPSVSPGKTWEGFLGAGMVTLIASYVCSSISGKFTLNLWLLIGLAIWIFGSIGDLVESKFKRTLDIKDSGQFLPGHGGILDRFDGFFFSIPFVIILIEIFG